MKQLLFLIIVVLAISFTSCTENYSNGERIGMVTQFSEKGWMWKSWEGSLNLTQTGMNSSGAEPFLFSIDNDQNETEPLRLTLDSAAQYGWKIKLIYHQTLGKNWFNNRGTTNHFVKEVQVLDKNPIANAFNGITKQSPGTSGKVIDTIYVVIQPEKK